MRKTEIHQDGIVDLT